VKTSKNKPVQKTGFFLLADAKLLSIYEFQGENVLHIPSDNNDVEVGIKTRNSVSFRQDQLADGIIEDGEDMEMTDIKYVAEENYEKRVSLDADSAGKMKKKNYYSNFQVFKGNYK